MLVVVALIGIVASMAFGGWQRVMWRVQSLGAADEIRNALMNARSDARTNQSYTGVHFDPSNKRYLIFADSSGSDVHDGLYSSGERVLRDWTELPSKLLFYSVASSIPPTIPLRPCGGSATTAAPTAQSGTFSVVFKPNGQCMATFSAKLGIQSYPSDTFRIEVFPPTGLVTMED